MQVVRGYSVKCPLIELARPRRVGVPMAKLGGDTRAILREMGHDDAHIDAWLAAGIAKEQLHDAFLPH